jgi:subtilisin family serine protease
MSRAVAARALVAAVAAAAATLATMAPAGAGPNPLPASAGASVRVIVTYDAMASSTAVAGSVDAVGSVTRTLQRSPHLVATVPAAALARLRQAPHVRAVQLDLPQKAALDSSLHVIRADAAQSAGFTGAGTTVAILDTGVDVDHPFLGGRVIAQYCSSHPMGAGERSLCPNGRTTDDSADVDSLPACSTATVGPLCDHGTHVAGIAAGDGSAVPGLHPRAGVAPGASIIAMQIFTRFDNPAFCGAPSCIASYPSDQLAALDELAVLDTAHPSWNIVAANLSLGGGSESTPCDTDVRKAAIDTLLGHGIATVIAAGNNGFDDSVSNPGCISSAVTVGATDDTDGVAWFSNRGPLLDLFAPGVSIISSVPDDDWADYDGTSMATPHVVGALALLRQHAPTRPIASLVQDLRATGVPVTYPSAGSSVTTRRIDAMNAVVPRVTLAPAPAAALEGGALITSGFWTSTGGAVTVTASVGTVSQGIGTWSWTATRGDDTTQPVTLTATDAGGAARTVALTARWANVAPSTALTAAVTRPWNGGSLAVARVGTPAAFSVAVTDPGSDDISTSWAFGDGTRSRARSLLHPPVVDPASSPTVEPRALVARVTHTYDRACTRTLRAGATDDDGGVSPTRARTVVVFGTGTTRRPPAWWSAEYRGTTSSLTAADRACLLGTARTLSTAFPEKRALTTSADAVTVLRPTAPATARAAFDARLLAVWLDVANGAVDPFAAFDADGNGSTETTVGAWLLAAERTRNTSSATSGALKPLTSVLARIPSTG